MIAGRDKILVAPEHVNTIASKRPSSVKLKKNTCGFSSPVGLFMHVLAQGIFSRRSTSEGRRNPWWPASSGPNKAWGKKRFSRTDSMER